MIGLLSFEVHKGDMRSGKVIVLILSVRLLAVPFSLC